MAANSRNFAVLAMAIAMPLLTACETLEISDIDNEEDGNYSAAGTEPFWSFNVEGGTMKFRPVDGEEIVVKSFTMKDLPDYRREYRSKRITADISPGPCNDGMSDRSYYDNVSVRVDGKEYRGCGGGVMMQASLAGTKWQLVSLNGDKISDPEKTDIRFDGKTISGTAGCNRMSGSYKIDNDTISFGPIAATKMACPDPWMQIETKFFSVLASRATYRRNGYGLLLLRGESGNEAALRLVE